jgi:hypothetical protein
MVCSQVWRILPRWSASRPPPRAHSRARSPSCDQAESTLSGPCLLHGPRCRILTIVNHGSAPSRDDPRQPVIPVPPKARYALNEVYLSSARIKDLNVSEHARERGCRGCRGFRVRARAARCVHALTMDRARADGRSASECMKGANRTSP